MASSIFSGNSRFANDFAAVIERAVGIASLPLTQMQQSRVKLSDEAAALRSLDTKITSVQTTLQALQDSLGQQSFTPSVSDSTAVSARVSEGIREGSYSVEIMSLGGYTTTASSGNSVTDPATKSLSAATSFTLSVDDQSDGSPATEFTITPGGNNLNALADEINRVAGSSVQATIVNFGSSSTPDYRLSLQSAKLGQVAIQLNDGSNDLMDAGAPLGSKATYKVNGSSVIESDTRTVTIATGLSIDLMKASSSATITIGRSTGVFTNALTAFVNSYNSVVTALDDHRGEGEGGLKAHSILASIQDSLRSVTGYSTGNSGLSSLSAFGVYFDQGGKLTVNSTDLSSAISGKIAELTSFFGTKTGSGFLKSANDALNGLQDASTGVLKQTIATTDSAAALSAERIRVEQERIDDLRLTIERRMAQSDALIAAMEQQVSYFTGMMEAMKQANESYR